MPELTFAETPERREILDTLEKVVTLLKSRAAVHRAARSEVRHHRAMNRAQTAQNLADMLALDWTQDDAEAAARPPV